jgi:hypothetical protein
MTAARLAPRERIAFRQFVEAVVDLSDDPGPENLERYLAASQALDDSRRKGSSAAKRRSRRRAA